MLECAYYILLLEFMSNFALLQLAVRIIWSTDLLHSSSSYSMEYRFDHQGLSGIFVARPKRHTDFIAYKSISCQRSRISCLARLTDVN